MNMQDEIKRVAYELYEKSGRIGGRELENWIAAEKIVMARHAQNKKSGKAGGPSKPHSFKKPSTGSKVKKDEAPKTTPKDIGGGRPRAKKNAPKKI